VKALLDEFGRLFGRLGILINNAGFVASHRLPAADLAVIHRIIDVNLKGPFNCIVAALDLLRASKGVIVNIGALNSRAVSAAGSAYEASKAGLVAMTTNLAHDLGPLGIRINAVAPPLTESDMGRWAQAEAGTSKAGIGAAQRPALPEEVGRVVAYFCSPSAMYVSGETLYMGGGFIGAEATT
jgi:NAD(P)-dependent dehydrogenase (short-subunit alcohol dehydrogenase family)